MTREHAKQLLKTAKGLFPTMTPEQAEVLSDRLVRHDVHRALAVLKTHAANHEFLSLPQLIEGLRADEAADRARRQSYVRESVVQWIKQNVPHLNSLDDWTAVFQHHRESWEAVKNSRAPEIGKVAIRRMIRSHARVAALEIGLERAEADELADAAVEVGPGEVIRDVDILGSVIGAVVGSPASPGSPSLSSEGGQAR